ncbi:hypothetical protein DPMN_001170 [Dreissena polymorpha]|uniref:Uncharacterized protein n=1 Tax=Dreissena polymorpha TaxID=45954 RepID=A0A9D4RSU1_DREPO|nr:hypothetical protein DPMN_001170 [Dreissena polymorpha]
MVCKSHYTALPPGVSVLGECPLLSPCLPICLASASRSRRQAFLGCPPYLIFLSGILVRDCFVVLAAGFRKV